MKIFLAVAMCKTLYFIGKKMGKGSSLPGQLALKIFPNILKKLKLPKIIIAVTGSNGKTTTAQLIASAFERLGKNVAHNKEGSNQTEGIATLLLRTATLTGKVKADVVVMECDERYAEKIFREVKPTTILVTNLCRDQLTRNGHHEFILSCIEKAIAAVDTSYNLVLNADDPYVSTLSVQKNLYFGVDIKQSAPVLGIYDDGVYCPACKSKMAYTTRIIAHYGNYACSSCEHKRNTPQIEAVDFDDETGKLTLKSGESLKLSQHSLTAIYNYTAAIAAMAAEGIEEANAAKALDGVKLTGGRTAIIKLGGKDCQLLIAKHENSLAYNASLAWIKGQNKPCTVIILVDAISRKYYTTETSWLWDIDFELLGDETVEQVVLVGRYADELSARFAMTQIDKDKIVQIRDAQKLSEHIEKTDTEKIYAVTCFADKEKLH